MKTAQGLGAPVVSYLGGYRLRTICGELWSSLREEDELGKHKTRPTQKSGRVPFMLLSPFGFNYFDVETL